MSVPIRDQAIPGIAVLGDCTGLAREGEKYSRDATAEGIFSSPTLEAVYFLLERRVRCESCNLDARLRVGREFAGIDVGQVGCTPLGSDYTRRSLGCGARWESAVLLGCRHSWRTPEPARNRDVSRQDVPIIIPGLR
jgi:hypothetical protein